MNFEDLDALLESKYENDLKDQIEEFEEENIGLDSLTFGLDSNSLKAQEPILGNVQHSLQPLVLQPPTHLQTPSVHQQVPLIDQQVPLRNINHVQPQVDHFQQMNVVNVQHQNMMRPPHSQRSSVQQMQHIHNIHNMQHIPNMQQLQQLQQLHLSQMGIIPGPAAVPIPATGPTTIPGIMTMEDVESLLKSQSKKDSIMENKRTLEVMSVEDVEMLLKAKLSLSSSERKEEKKGVSCKEKETLSLEKEKKNRVHLEKIKRPSQAERRKSKSVDQEFFRREFRDSKEEKKKVKVFIMKWEKELIAKIQISQLVSDDPIRDDFYCQIYTQNSAARKESLGKKERGKKKSGGVNKIQQQMTRLLEKRKTKQAKVSKGALGKISVLSSRNPRQVLSLDSMKQKEKSKVEFSLSPKSVLSSIEKVYDNVLELETLKRSQDLESEEWKQKFDFQLCELWENLGLSRSVSFSLPHPFGFFLKFSKGIKVIPRLLKFLNSSQQFDLFSTLMCRLECVEIANLPVNAEKPEIDAFMAYVIPPFVDYVSEIGLDSVNSLMKTILERHNMVWVATSKIGLAFLTAFLSRAELLKQGPQVGGEPPNENDLTLWNDIYNFLFSSMQGSFSNLFPVSSSDKNESLPGDIYIWQFLASLAVCATNVEQQTVLVTEVRNNIIVTAKMATDPKALANVDLFLTALGLGIDASQLASSV